MSTQHKCPKCGSELNIAFKPTNKFFEKIRLENGLFCNSCEARIKVNYRTSYFALILFVPYIAALSWNLFVNLYGMEHFGLDKLDQMWLILAICLFIIGVLIQSRYKVYVLYGKPSN